MRYENDLHSEWFGVNLIANLKKILSAARSSGIKIVYVPHHNYKKEILKIGNSWHLHIRDL
jgi:nicotinamidase-related amidase